MSASQEKKARAQRLSEGTDKKRNALTEEERKAKKFKTNAIIAVVAIMIVVVAAIIINSNLFYTGFTAVKVGNTSYNAAELNVFFRNTYNSVYSGLGDFASYVLDTSTPLDEQQYYGSEDQTWADYLYDQTLENMRQITALYDDAMANGYTLTAEDQESIDSQVAMMQYYAVSNGLSNTNQYLTAIYGKGVNEKVFTSVLTKMIVAQSWSAQVSDGFTYTDAELDGYYSENADDLDYFSYYAYLVGTGDEGFDEIEDEDAKQAAAHDAAEEIASAADEGEFLANIDAYSNGESTTDSPSYTQGQYLSSIYKDWLLDAGRQAGDTDVIDTDGGAYAMFYVERDGNDYNLRNMRHILINTEANDDGEYTEEAIEAARARIDEIYAEWQADPTEDKFAELANANSDDGGSNTNGGLYENIVKHQMVDAINSFLFEEGSQAGDTTIVYNSGSYEGWHIVYYMPESDEIYKDKLAGDALRSEDYGSYLDNLTAGYEITTGSGLRFAKLK